MAIQLKINDEDTTKIAMCPPTPPVTFKATPVSVRIKAKYLGTPSIPAPNLVPPVKAITAQFTANVLATWPQISTITTKQGPDM